MMDFFAKTDKGQRRRMNQDYVFASDQPVGALPNLFLLADGITLSHSIAKNDTDASEEAPSDEE